MSIILDILGSIIVMGLMMLLIFTLMGNLNQTNFEKTFSMNIQANNAELARILEFDLLKAGYHTSRPAIKHADSISVQFSSDIKNMNDTGLVSYSLGSLDTTTKNPRDRTILRQWKNEMTSMHLGVASLKFSYYDSSGHEYPSPVSAAQYDSIRAIHVKMLLESPEPVYDARSGESTYQAVFWEKTMYPKNLMKLK